MREHLERLRPLKHLLPLLLVLPAPILLRGVGPGRLLGGPFSEAGRHVWSQAQVLRWLTGEAPWGHADLIAFPEGRGFWPVSPLLNALELPLTGVFGLVGGCTALAVLLILLAGAGPYALCRSLGLGRAGALAAGLSVQLAPFLLTNLGDAILEVYAVGIACLAGAALARWIQTGERRWLAWAGLGVFATATSSPYFALYLALVCVFVGGFTWRQWRRWLAYAGVAALACGLAVSPYLLTERGKGGRLTETHEQGWTLQPDHLVDPDSGRQVMRRPNTARGGPGEAGPMRGPPSTLERELGRWQPGAVATLAVLLGLAFRRSRPWAGLGLFLFLVGPGLPMLLRLTGLPGPTQAPLALLQEQLGLTLLGNPTRLFVPFILVSAVALAAMVDKRAWAAALACGLVVAETGTVKRGIELPSVPLTHEDHVLEAITGPFFIFPTGDPPAWQQDVTFGESMFLAGLADQPVAYDFSTGEQGLDLPGIVTLARAGGVPLGMALNRRFGELPPQPFSDFSAVLILEDRLPPDQRSRLRAWLEEHGTLLAEGDNTSAWKL
jgi:hypothetical protein